MAAARKTVRTTDLIALANKMLAESTADFAHERQGVYLFIEHVLMENHAYAGFQFTDGNNGRTDDTRRRYYTHHTLQKGA